VRIDGELMEIWLNEVCDRYPTDSKLLHSINSHFTIPEAVIMEVNAKRFFLSILPAPDTILNTNG